ncbi:unnamed protein product (mitochondrion) [Plasmodiophora brassicae]|uniref:PPM-type phosphatase domain-containing protein n=1 Tax=Plasmodiophora brassicae TaxID=37360 RepID=A0A0G4IQZ3_PLABS|nr:hypothetical protein PBRA_000995 [Plasmodiophora brassicae]SPQ97946.1 unnamed protein product [Plasmodiophora brassicae]
MPPPPFAASGGFSIQCKTMRHPNEDRFTIVEALSTADASVGFFAVYDGHCGDACSAFLADTLHNRVRESPAFASGDYKQALADGLLSTERTYHMQVIENEKAGVVDENPDDDGPKQSSGSCVVATIRTGPRLYIANLGDCRAICSVNNMSKMLTRDHKATDPQEKARVVEAGGFVRSNRMFGLMSVTRSIGDFEYKDGSTTGTLISTPDLFEEEITPGHQCLIMACDGLWDVVDNALAVETAVDGLRAGQSASETARELAKLAVQRGSNDDITVVVVPLNI